ncbi:MAG: hypothetical protein FJ115_17365 [Deltaproteobacteria bacterium]|nr:hypothetical protein [Deltaproteobacteria bacterium]MBM4325324.1 hypothetical protein [Deltaproteobacteria bacterium]MBM4348069.1 hypothetical protein [Deltaproteobacteria bacterium]
MTDKTPIPLPKDTKAYICANCGAVALDAARICKVQGMGKKIDWCCSATLMPPKTCHNRKNNIRWRCKKCGQTSVNAELLCEPEKLELDD